MHFCSSPGNISILFQVLMVLAYNNHDNTFMLHHQTKTLISIKKDQICILAMSGSQSLLNLLNKNKFKAETNLNLWP